MPTTELGAQTEALAAFLRALPDCRTPEATLRAALAAALALTGATDGAAVAHGEAPALIPGTDPALIKVAQQAAEGNAGGRRGMVGVPLSDADSTEGGLALAVAPPDTHTAEALAALAGAAGYVLCRLRQMRQATRRTAELETLYDVATAIGSTLNMRALLTQIVERTGAALDSEACTLMLLDRIHNELIFEIPTGEAGQALRQLRVPVSEGICGWVARNAQPALVNDPRGDNRFDQRVDANSGFQTRNALAVPLLVRGTVTGVLEVLNKHADAPYSDEDLGLLTTLAGQVAVALDNAQLYSSLQSEHERLLAAEDEVRKELARDLHDGPAQRLAAIVMQVEVLRKLITFDPSRLPGELDSLESLARRANREVRTMQFQLRPIMLETRGLRAAIEYYIHQLRETDKTEYIIEAQGCEGRLDPKVEQAAFGIVQEALGNLRKHAGANHAWVRMREEADCWNIEIQDDGRGFDVSETLRSYENRGSLGLLNMRERGAAVGGRFELRSTPGAGTMVMLEIPTAGAPVEPV